MAFMAIIMGLRLLFYILWGFNYWVTKAPWGFGVRLTKGTWSGPIGSRAKSEENSLMGTLVR